MFEFCHRTLRQLVAPERRGTGFGSHCAVDSRCLGSLKNSGAGSMKEPGPEVRAMTCTVLEGLTTLYTRADNRTRTVDLGVNGNEVESEVWGEVGSCMALDGSQLLQSEKCRD